MLFNLTELSPSLIQIPTEYQDYLSTNFYSFDFSPKDKIVTSIPLYYTENEEVLAYQFAILPNTIELIGTVPLNNAQNLVWNEITESYYFITYVDNSTEIKDFYSNKTWFIPDQRIAKVEFAISSSLEYIAFGYGAVDGVKIFKCTE